jgi:hypothetical protein
MDPQGNAPPPPLKLTALLHPLSAFCFVTFSWTLRQSSWWRVFFRVPVQMSFGDCWR